MVEENMVEEKEDKTEVKAKALMTVDEVMAYLGIGETMVRKILRDPKCGFGFRIGNRLYADKKKLDKWIDRQC